MRIPPLALLSGWVVFRLVWGFSGPKYARFSSFPLTSPKQVMHSVQRVVTKQTEQTPGHTTVGGLAVYLMLIFHRPDSGVRNDFIR